MGTDAIYGVHLTTLVARFFLLILVIFVAAACGGAPASDATAVPTSTTIPTFNYVAPTAPPSVATSAAATEAAGAAGNLDPVAVERGRDRYVALGCAECHGEQGEGVDDVAPLAASTQTEAEFIAFMRSGGELGSEHQYATNRLSDSGGRNLYQYLLSLREGG
jgi:cytochrome c553